MLLRNQAVVCCFMLKITENGMYLPNLIYTTYRSLIEASRITDIAML